MRPHRHRKGQCHKRVAHLVVGHDLALLGVEEPIALFQSRYDPFDGVIEVSHRYGIAPAPGRKERRLIDQIGKVGAGEAGRQGGDLFRIHIRPEFRLFQINFKNLDATLLSGRSTRTCRSKRPARSNAGSRISGRFVAARRTRPLDESKPSNSTSGWVQRLLFLVMPTCNTGGAAGAPQRV